MKPEVRSASEMVGSTAAFLSAVVPPVKREAVHAPLPEDLVAILREQVVRELVGPAIRSAGPAEFKQYTAKALREFFLKMQAAGSLRVAADAAQPPRSAYDVYTSLSEKIAKLDFRNHQVLSDTFMYLARALRAEARVRHDPLTAAKYDVTASDEFFGHFLVSCWLGWCAVVAALESEIDGPFAEWLAGQSRSTATSTYEYVRGFEHAVGVPSVEVLADARRSVRGELKAAFADVKRPSAVKNSKSGRRRRVGRRRS
jgi:hypothetical protein